MKNFCPLQKIQRMQIIKNSLKYHPLLKTNFNVLVHLPTIFCLSTLWILSVFIQTCLQKFHSGPFFLTVPHLLWSIPCGSCHLMVKFSTAALPWDFSPFSLYGVDSHLKNSQGRPSGFGRRHEELMERIELSEARVDELLPCPCGREAHASMNEFTAGRVETKGQVF